ncbi:MAG: gliding motility-associated C-terminal domain-containing protein [Bacteroidales bacterium]|nr:gliding motility-associated C-terminal domain-containing protein [Bacteroidales bacterium]
MKRLIIFTITLIILKPCLGQISQPSEPYSNRIDLRNKNMSSIILSDSIPLIKMQAVDENIIEQIKQNNEMQENSFQFAYSFYVDIDVKKNAVIDSLDVGLLYRLSINSENAYSLNLIFKKYTLPKGAKLFIYNNDKTDIIGAFTSNNNKSSGRLATVPVKGEEIIVEYFEPYYTNFTGQLVIGVISHDFIDIVNSEDIANDFGNSGPCQVDINCSEGANWQTEKRAVCRIVSNGNSLCTGTLLNNTNYDGRPYFLTANHCICSQEEADDCVFIFNYESPSCDGGDGSTDQSISGATLRATNAESDFVLLEFTHKPLSTYNPYYAGWDRNIIQNAGGVGIHHPAGDVKKIATHTITPQTSDCMDFEYNAGCGSSFYPNENFWKINWIETTNGHSVTEGGSSGSPLFNNNHLVIGQLFGAGGCDNPNCNNPANDIANYGKISASWDLGSNSESRLRDWLDPLNSNVTTLNGANVCQQGVAEHLTITHTIESGAVELYQATKTITASNIIRSGANVTYEAGEGISLEPNFLAEEGCTFTAQIKSLNCVPGCYPVTIDLLPNIFTPNGDGINDELCYPVTNATYYDFEAYNRWGNLIHSSSGSVSGDYVCVWDGDDACSGCYYAVIITFGNECNEVTEAYSIMVLTDEDKNITDTTNTKDAMLLNIVEEPQTFGFELYPNPTSDYFSIKITTSEFSPYSIDIFNSTGVLIYKISEVNEQEITLSNEYFTSGVYYVRLKNDKNIVTKKLIVN